jgi:ribonuclease J
VDHSVAGSLALLVEGDGKAILYSGDLRLHGRNPRLIEQLLHRASGKQIDILLMEGTNFSLGRGKGHSEHELQERIATEIREASGLVFALFTPTHLDRLETFIRAGAAAGRTFVPDLYAAYTMHMFQRPGAAWSDTRKFPIYFNELGDRKIGRSKVAPDFKKRRIEKERLLTEQSRYVVAARPSTFELDFQSSVPDGATLIYSMWSGYLNQPDWRQVRSWSDSSGSRFVHHHTSGHIFAEDIHRLIEQVNPKRVVPVHTTEPHLFPLVGETEQLKDALAVQV